jgi:thiol:disulfide interchange protein
MNIKTCRFCRSKYESSWVLPEGFCSHECGKSYNKNLEDQQKIYDRDSRIPQQPKASPEEAQAFLRQHEKEQRERDEKFAESIGMNLYSYYAERSKSDRDELIANQERLAKLEGLTRDEWLAKEAAAESRSESITKFIVIAIILGILFSFTSCVNWMSKENQKQNTERSIR